MRAVACGLAVVVALGANGTRASAQGEATTKTMHLAGIWRGTSICTPAGKPACHDEVVVYRVRDLAPAGSSTPSATRDSAEQIEIVMNKIVKAKEDSMGTITCARAADPRHIACPMRGWTWAFELRGDTLSGTLANPTNVVWRNVRVVRAARSS